MAARREGPTLGTTEQHGLEQRRPKEHGLEQRGLRPIARRLAALLLLLPALRLAGQPGNAALSVPWTPVAPQTLSSPSLGPVGGRILTVAVDPGDPTGNTVYIGAAGGLFRSVNANSAAPSFAPLTDFIPSLDIPNNQVNLVNVGAVTVQPGRTGVVLAGTGDPSNQPDSLYGTGLLRSSDGGNTWTVIPAVFNPEIDMWMYFFGEAFSGFAWSTTSPNTVVAGLVPANGAVKANAGYEAGPSTSNTGLIYSLDAGQNWLLATVQDGPSQPIQQSYQSSGLVVLSVVWNPVRRIFVAAIRYHGLYSSPDGVTWNRLASQPGAALNNGMICTPAGAMDCPIYSAALAVQPGTGDMFALTASETNADNGLWQDVCAASGGQCAAPQPSFSRQIPIAGAVETAPGVIDGAAQTMWLAAIPAGADTLLFAGTEDILRCSLAAGCTWRNTTNVHGCGAARVGANQHGFAWLPGSSLLYFANDAGLWRSADAVNQQAAACSADDAAHYTNLNATLAGLAEVGDMAVDPASPAVQFAALGASGTSGGGSGAWQAAVPGPGRHVEAGRGAQAGTWLATSGAGVSISGCARGADCGPGDFGLQVGSAQTGADGAALSEPAAWTQDPGDPAQVFVGTCRLWRGAADGTGWSSSSVLSGMLDGQPAPACQGTNTQISAIAASGPIAGRGDQAERLYVGMAGAGDGARTKPGRLYGALITPFSVAGSTTWSDLSASPVLNGTLDTVQFNKALARISDVVVDPTDASGRTVYATVAGFSGRGLAPLAVASVPVVYGSTDGGASWNNLTNDLPNAPANALLIDPENPSIAYVATDIGVYVSTSIMQCSNVRQNCWSPYGTGLPAVRIDSLTAVDSGGQRYLLAGTRGRGVWQAELASTALANQTATGSLAPATLAFASQAVATTSASESFTLTNTGGVALNPEAATSSGQDFVVTDACPASLAPGASCSIGVVFAPLATGPRSATLTVAANVQGGVLTAAMTGTGAPGSTVVLTPLRMSFGSERIGQTTPVQYMTVANMGAAPVSLQTPTIQGPFLITANTCGPVLPVNTSCTLGIAFAPVASGAASGTLVTVDAAGTQTAVLSGTGQSGPTDGLSATSLQFGPQTIDTTSAAQQVTVSNNGDSPLNNITVSVTGDFGVQNLCGMSLPGHGTCAVRVVYQPRAVGAETGTLTVQDDLGTQLVSLTGSGTPPPTGSGAGITLSPISMSFGIQGVGSISSPQLLTVINSGSVPLSGLEVAATAGYGVTNNACNVTVAPGASCTVGVTFAPVSTGQQSGSVQVTAAGSAVPYSLPVAGTGADFTLSVQGSSSSTVTGGSTATYQLLLTPVGASAGQVAFTCSGTPPGSTCATNPAAVTMSGNGATATIQVTVTTPGASARVQPGAARPGVGSSRRGAGWPAELPWPAGAAMAALFGCLALRRPRRWPLLALCVLGLGLGGCGLSFKGGNGSGSGSGGDTSAAGAQGSYTLTVQAGAPGLTRSVTLSLVVE